MQVTVFAARQAHFSIVLKTPHLCVCVCVCVFCLLSAAAHNYCTFAVWYIHLYYFLLHNTKVILKCKLLIWKLCQWSLTISVFQIWAQFFFFLHLLVTLSDLLCIISFSDSASGIFFYIRFIFQNSTSFRFFFFFFFFLLYSLESTILHYACLKHR